MTQTHEENRGGILLYQTPDGKAALEVSLQGGTVWLSQKQIVDLFDKNVRTVSEHIRNVFKERELEESSVIRNFRITAADGKSYDTRLYNLDVIISVGYRVKSKRGTQFRIWATQTLKEHLTRGYTLNRQRFEQNARELETAPQLVRKAAAGEARCSGRSAKPGSNPYSATWNRAYSGRRHIPASSPRPRTFCILSSRTIPFPMVTSASARSCSWIF